VWYKLHCCSILISQATKREWKLLSYVTALCSNCRLVWHQTPTLDRQCSPWTSLVDGLRTSSRSVCQIPTTASRQLWHVWQPGFNLSSSIYLGHFVESSPFVQMCPGVGLSDCGWIQTLSLTRSIAIWPTLLTTLLTNYTYVPTYLYLPIYTHLPNCDN